MNLFEYAPYMHQLCTTQNKHVIKIHDIQIRQVCPIIITNMEDSSTKKIIYRLRKSDTTTTFFQTLFFLIHIEKFQVDSEKIRSIFVQVCDT